MNKRQEGIVSYDKRKCFPDTDIYIHISTTLVGIYKAEREMMLINLQLQFNTYLNTEILGRASLIILGNIPIIDKIFSSLLLSN